MDSNFWTNETVALYSVNNILGARIGGVPFALLLGLLVLLPALLWGARRRGSFSASARFAASRLFLLAGILFALRSGLDQARNARLDLQYLSGGLDEKIAALNPPGYYALLLETKKRAVGEEEVELRAPKPYPWEKGAFYLYPHRLKEGASLVVSYRTPAPPDSAGAELLFRRAGFGSIYRRTTR
ncbi:MAG: hypothetical protein ABIK65_12470 [Candidatus Eisenbacteria bacterium]